MVSRSSMYLCCVLLIGCASSDHGDDLASTTETGTSGDPDGGTTCGYNHTLTLSGETLAEWIATGMGTVLFDCTPDMGGPADIDPADVTPELCAAICDFAVPQLEECEFATIGVFKACSYEPLPDQTHAIHCQWTAPCE